MENNYDVIVVGAGLSGLIAARELAKKQKKVCVLEARNRIGGRIFSQKTPSGKIVELGAQWIGLRQPRIEALISEFSIQTFPDIYHGKKLLFLNNKLASFENEIPPVSLLGLLELYLNMHRIDKQHLLVPLKAAFEAKNADEWDGITIDAWIKTHTHTTEVRELFNIFIETVYAVSSRDMSFLFFLSSLRDSHGPESNIEDAHSIRVDGGLSQICDHLAKELNDAIKLNQAVREISQTPISITIKTANNSYTARKAIIAIPPVLASQILYDPPLPAIREKLHQRMPMGSAIKCFAIYKKPFWREKGLAGKLINNTGLIRLIDDVSPSDSSYGVLVAFILADAVSQIPKSSREFLSEEVLTTLTKFFGEEAKKPEEFIFHNWNEEFWTRGGYAGYMPPGVMTSLGKTIPEPSEHIHWAGTEMAFEWNGYMEGAIESGMRAATQIMNLLE